MENAADALKMAAAVLIFVLALSISINAFGEVRQISQTILDYRDREYDYTYVEKNDTTERIVGAETIIPTIYRAYKENYKIVFDINGIESIYEKKNAQAPGGTEKINTIDLKKQVLGNEAQKEEFIQVILYGSKADNFTNIANKFSTNSGIILNPDGIYDKIKSKGNIKEKLGVYYQEDETSSSDGQESSTTTPDTNKTTKRVITFTDK